MDRSVAELVAELGPLMVAVEDAAAVRLAHGQRITADHLFTAATLLADALIELETVTGAEPETPASGLLH